MNGVFPYGINPYVQERLKTREVKVGDLIIGGNSPIKVQTMTTTDTMDVEATVAQSIRCIEAGSELIRITAPSRNEASNLALIKKSLRSKGYKTPLVADIHYTPNAAEIAAEIVEKVRINPGNYIDKKKFEVIEYTDRAYENEVEKIYERFAKLIQICKTNGTALRIGTNHGSLSDRIMSRYGDTPIGMVESAMEFLRIARKENFHQIVLSMKASNTRVMTHAYRLLVKTMQEEFAECYPLHLGITEAGDGEDGRIKSAIGIGGLLQDGIGDTIRVSLTEDPEFEIPVCHQIIQVTQEAKAKPATPQPQSYGYINDPFSYQRRVTREVRNIGKENVPVVLVDMRRETNISYPLLERLGYIYDEPSDKWTLKDSAVDFVLAQRAGIDHSISLPTTLGIVVSADEWESVRELSNYFPCCELAAYTKKPLHPTLNFVEVDMADFATHTSLLTNIKDDPTVVFILTAPQSTFIKDLRRFCLFLHQHQLRQPIILRSHTPPMDEALSLVQHSVTLGSPLIDGLGDGVCLEEENRSWSDIINLSFGILQGTRTRISKTEYISCPSCGRTLFDLQTTTQKIRNATHHLKGLKIAVMGCIVNGPGEMADADFGYVGSGVGKVSLYKNKEIVKKNVDSEVAVDELVALIKENNLWKDKK